MKRAAMSSRERSTAALRRQPVDRIPWTVDLDYYDAALRIQGRFDPKYEGVEGFLRLQEELGIDPYFCDEYVEPCEVRFQEVESETRRSDTEEVTTYACPHGTLVAVKRFLPTSFCWAIYKYPVQTPSDLETLLGLLRRRRIIPRLDRYDELQKRWGERGLLILGLPRSPVSALIAEWCGMQAISFLSVDAPDLFEETLETLDRLYDPLFDAIAEYRPVVVHFCDNISGENVGSFWDRHMAPRYAKRLKQLHDAGIVCVIHNDGTVRSVLGKIARVGFDGAEAITPAPVGDASVSELRAIAGRDDFILWGMVPGAAFSRNWSEEAFRRYVSDVLVTCKHPMILGSADQVPPDAELSRVRVVADMLRE